MEFIDGISKNCLSYEGNGISFKYRILYKVHTYMDNVKMTRYLIYMVVDDSSVHERYKDYHFKEIEHGFLLKKVEKRGDFNEETLNKVIESALRLNITNKIKVNGYEKIRGILSGTDYSI